MEAKSMFEVYVLSVTWVTLSPCSIKEDEENIVAIVCYTFFTGKISLQISKNKKIYNYLQLNDMNANPL